MTWNYRVVKFEQENDEPWLEICEVYYNTHGKPNAHTKGVSVGSETIEGLKWILEKMLESLDKPIIEEMK